MTVPYRCHYTCACACGWTGYRTVIRPARPSHRTEGAGSPSGKPCPRCGEQPWLQRWTRWRPHYGKVREGHPGNAV